MTTHSAESKKPIPEEYWVHRNCTERWDYIGVRYNLLKETENGAWYNFNKTAVKSWARAEYRENPTTKLNQCSLCGRMSVPKKVCERNDVWGWNLNNGVSGTSKGMLCMGCWNKVKAVVKRRTDADKIKRATNQLNRRLQQCQKLKQQAS